MPRKARQHFIAPNVLYHLVVRGNNQKNIYRSKRDYKKFLRILETVKEQFPFYLYSYSLLPNHFHLEVESQKTPISKIMHRLNFLYVQYFHHRYHTSGHLFQDRFYSNVINKDSYLWEVSRYIDLNAPRAGLIKRPEDYPWCSYQVYSQKDYTKKLIDRDRFLLGYIAKDLEKGRLTYLKFVEDSLKSKKEPEFPLDRRMI